ncbi:GerAB/ArcD/ProY family transporter [Bacillus hwajinpoensis]|uniref:GerAB/ArcD/ProY family transporter n=1 Tax=Guptibacillus hwajinpoensis TaxID=208199 RepID=A0A845EQV9_9BACL|nr:GerAB/ArcD/ProY family transporter [Pseudalkalibacillus hwajinpoensis]MYL62152.1 GerAB/ArcD/ProY family transporter [Pseudalkalibacillus hwajinpoensis]
MGSVKLSSKQLFSIMVLFELGSSIVVGLGMEAKQDAWITILIGMCGGFILFFVYASLFKRYPDIPLSEYAQKIIGKWPGKIIAILYSIYFIYIAARVLRDFGELIVTSTLSKTPLLVINILISVVILYGALLGIEVIGRSAEIFFVIVMCLGIIFIGLILLSNLFHIENLQPVLENGWSPVLQTAFPLVLTFPFGEMIVFTMFLPFLNEKRDGQKTGMYAILLSGIILTITVIFQIGVMGAYQAASSTFPLLDTIGKVNIQDIIQRLDPIAILILMIGGFIKIIIFLLGSAISLSTAFSIKKWKVLMGIITCVALIASILIERNYLEHIQIGLNVVPYYVHPPFQIGIPLLLFLVMHFKNWRAQK